MSFLKTPLHLGGCCLACGPDNAEVDQLGFSILPEAGLYLMQRKHVFVGGGFICKTYVFSRSKIFDLGGGGLKSLRSPPKMGRRHKKEICLVEAMSSFITCC